MSAQDPPTTDAEVQADRAKAADKPAVPTAEELAEYDRETIRLVNEQERNCAEAEAGYAHAKAMAAEARQLVTLSAYRLRALVRERAENRGKPPEKTLLDLVPPAKWRDRDITAISGWLSDALWQKVRLCGCATLGDLSEALGSFDPAAGPPFGLDMGEVFIVKSQIDEIIQAEADEAEDEAGRSQADPELWRHYPIERWTRFGITVRDVEKLAAGEVKRETGRTPVVTVGDLSDFTKPTATGYSRGYADIKGIGKAGADRLAAAEELFWRWWRDAGEVEFAQERGLIRGNAATGGRAGGAAPAAAGGAEPEGESSRAYDRSQTVGW